ncbi:hypothetical protein EDB89DRAFT_2064306 [Lactarius sanguifluus]|nr:hypothetical protein EDB89DRAFT_2064306 [Lactarius sanguifluus]
MPCPPNQLLQVMVVSRYPTRRRWQNNSLPPYRQTPSQEQGRLDAARLAQFQVNQTGAPSSGSTGATSPTSDAQARPIRPSEMKDEGKMFVGGLSWDTNEEGLRNYFSESGQVDACTIVRDADGRLRGFAFLVFEDPMSVNAVMIREHFLDGKAIDPKRAIPREEHPRNTRYFKHALHVDEQPRRRRHVDDVPTHDERSGQHAIRRHDGRGVGMMGGFNPMMGMGRFGMGGMGGMGNAGVGGMSPMASASNMGGGANMGTTGGRVGGMRHWMGPIGMTRTRAGMGGMVPAGGGMGAAAGMQGAVGAMGGMGMGMRQNMGMMGDGVGHGRPGMNQSPGPAHDESWPTCYAR